MFKDENVLFEEEYRVAGLYDKIVTLPELAKIVTTQGDKNEIVRRILQHLINKSKGGSNKFVLGYVTKRGTICSDGKKRVDIPYPIKICFPVPTPTCIEYVMVDDTDDKICHSYYSYITYDILEKVLLTKEERSKLEAVRLVLAKEKILALFKKGSKSVNLEVIRKSTRLDPERFIPAIDKLVNTDKKLRLEGEAYVLNKN